MALEETNGGNGFYMPVAPAGNYGGNGFFGGDGWWVLILFLLIGGGGMWGMNGMGGMNMLYPWLNNSEHISDGFRDQYLNTNVTSIRDSISGLSTQLCNSFSQAEIAANSRQMADMQQNFALQSALQNCCCENRLAVANLGADIAREACADRATSTANTQAILDKLCQLELDNYKREADNLRSELQYARGQASQVEQTARILAGQNSEVDALYNRLSNCPVPSTPVYGRTPIFTCAQNVAGGCGCSGTTFAN